MEERLNSWLQRDCYGTCTKEGSQMGKGYYRCEKKC